MLNEIVTQKIKLYLTVNDNNEPWDLGNKDEKAKR